jgi:hypothetical protein
MPEPGLSLTRGGPFYHLLRRVHLLDHPRWIWLVAFAWLPLAIATLVELAITGHLDSIATDVSVHVRLLVMLPLLIVAEDLLEARCRNATEHVREERIADRASLDAIITRTEHLRDAWLPEVLIVVIVVGVGQLWLRSYVWTSLGAPTFARAWCFLVALPLAQFLIVRWLWRWALWTYVLARLASLGLSLDALHPDQAAGLKVLSGPTEAFAVFVASLSAMASATWMMKLHAHATTLKTLSPLFFTFVVVVIILACAPLMLFSRKLYRARHRDANAYHRLARDYVDAFRTKWLAEGTSAVLGTSDIQSLNDLGGSFRTAEATRLYPFGVRTIINLWTGVLVPLVPLLLAEAPIDQVATHFGRMLFGVAP